MKFTKPSLTFKQQAATLINRGMIAQKSELVEKLQAVNYYRLSGYIKRSPSDHPRRLRPLRYFRKLETVSTVVIYVGQLALPR